MLKGQRLIKNQLNISRQQIYNWRKIGLIEVSNRTPGGHFLYSFEDLKVLKTIKLLRDTGISTRKIKKCILKINKLFPEIENPLFRVPVLVFGKKIVFVHNNSAYDAITGQAYLLDFRKIEKWAGRIIKLDKAHKLTEDLTEYFSQAKINLGS